MSYIYNDLEITLKNWAVGLECNNMKNPNEISELQLVGIEYNFFKFKRV